VGRAVRAWSGKAAAFAAATLVLVAPPAAAQALSSTTYYAPGDGTPNVWQVQIPVRASVGGVCGFAVAPSGSKNFPDVDQSSQSWDFPFQLNCTVPSRVAVVSANGGMKNLGATATGYVNIAAYDVTLNLDGNTTTANATCAASTLSATAGAPCAFRGPSSGTAGLRLADSSTGQTDSYLRVTTRADGGTAILIDGTYTDTLIVTISASP